MNKIYYKDITNEFLKNAKPSVNYGVHFAKSITKDGVTYRVNKKNKINTRNHEIENAYWFLSIMGGKIILLPEIGSKRYVRMADYKYKPVKGKSYFLENKEIMSSKAPGKYCIYHKIKDSNEQANVIIVDITSSCINPNDYHLYMNIAFKYTKKQVVLILKRKTNLLGIYTNKKRATPSDYAVGSLYK